jgi:hypothetical protein
LVGVSGLVLTGVCFLLILIKYVDKKNGYKKLKKREKKDFFLGGFRLASPSRSISAIMFR